MKETKAEMAARQHAEALALAAAGFKTKLLVESAERAERLAAAAEALVGEVKRVNEQMKLERETATRLPLEAALSLFMSRAEILNHVNPEVRRRTAGVLAAEFARNFGPPLEEARCSVDLQNAERLSKWRRWFREAVTLFVRLCDIPYDDDPNVRSGYEQSFARLLLDYSGEPKKDGAA